MYLVAFSSCDYAAIEKGMKKMSLNFVFQSGIILKKFYAIRIKHVEIAYWNILSDIPEYPSANWAVHLLVPLFVWSHLWWIAHWSTTLPFFQLKWFLSVHHCKTFLKASPDWDFSIFPFRSLAFPYLEFAFRPRLSHIFWAGCEVSQPPAPLVWSRPREAELNLVVG